MRIGCYLLNSWMLMLTKWASSLSDWSNLRAGLACVGLFRHLLRLFRMCRPSLTSGYCCSVAQTYGCLSGILAAFNYFCINLYKMCAVSTIRDRAMKVWNLCKDERFLVSFGLHLACSVRLAGKRLHCNFWLSHLSVMSMTGENCSHSYASDTK